MDAAKRKRLKAKGWAVGTAAEFLDVTAEESAYVEAKLALSRSLKQLRQKRNISQKDLAAALGSSQSRVAKMEAGDASVSLDLLVKALLAAGADRKQVAKATAAGAL
jgi:DNA-binding transcriptional regulator YiaG